MTDQECCSGTRIFPDEQFTHFTSLPRLRLPLCILTTLYEVRKRTSGNEHLYREDLCIPGRQLPLDSIRQNYWCKSEINKLDSETIQDLTEPDTLKLNNP